MTLDEILKAIPHLPPDAVLKIRSACALALSMTAIGEPATGRVAAGKRDSIDVVVSALRTALTELQMDIGGDAVLRKRLRIDEARATCNALIEFAEKQVPRDTRGQERLLSLGFRLLYDDLADMRVPISGRTMLAHAMRMPAVFDKHFPGYAALGMLKLALRPARKDAVI